MSLGFAHFDQSHRENFCAAVLLLMIENDDGARNVILRRLATSLGLPKVPDLAACGREARLAADSDESAARADLWFELMGLPGVVLVEVKTHDTWDARKVVAQVRDQRGRGSLLRSQRSVHAAVLLAPRRLCASAREHGLDLTIEWRSLLADLRKLPSPSSLAKVAIHHLEVTVEHETGIRGQTLDRFDELTRTIACLRAFLVSCVADIEGTHASGFNTTRGDGEPFRGSGWAWHGISVPFRVADVRYHLGIYRYVEAPPGREEDTRGLWLEAYRDSDQTAPVAHVRFDASTLAPDELDRVHDAFVSNWRSRRT